MRLGRHRTKATGRALGKIALLIVVHNSTQVSDVEAQGR